MHETLEQQFTQQNFANDYQLVNGVEMNTEDQILAVHGSYREEIVIRMDGTDLKTLTQWLGENKS